MQKLTTEQKEAVVGGKGLSGALLNGVGSIFKNVSSLINDTISTIATTVFMFNDTHHDKAVYKIGSNQITLDDTKTNQIKEQEQLKLQKAETISEDYHLATGSHQVNDFFDFEPQSQEHNLTGDLWDFS